MEAPERIYLQIEEEEGDYPDSIVEYISDATWCVDRIHESDVEYVRRDVAASQMRELLEHLIAVRSVDELPEAAEVWSDVVDMLEATSDD